MKMKKISSIFMHVGGFVLMISMVLFTIGVVIDIFTGTFLEENIGWMALVVISGLSLLLIGLVCLEILYLMERRKKS